MKGWWGGAKKGVGRGDVGAMLGAIWYQEVKGVVGRAANEGGWGKGGKWGTY